MILLIRQLKKIEPKKGGAPKEKTGKKGGKNPQEIYAAKLWNEPAEKALMKRTVWLTFSEAELRQSDIEGSPVKKG
ncbi:MAG: hypothetical protein IPP74_07365 [Alphaproteobacteria bacterium]|nr:hypothetical protein [Alphaproteobacteria bacterium]